MAQHLGGLLFVPADTAVFQLSEDLMKKLTSDQTRSSAANLNEELPQRRKHVRGVHAAQPTNGANRQFSNLKNLVVQRHKQRREVLRLSQVRVKALVQRHQHAVADVRVRIRDADHEQFVEDVSNRVHGRHADVTVMASQEVQRGTEQARAGAHRLQANLLVLTSQEVLRTVANKLCQRVT